jgi:hypothetical protein
MVFNATFNNILAISCQSILKLGYYLFIDKEFNKSEGTK